MKKAGIVADNYKVERFKKELTARGFPNFSVKKFTEDTSSIIVDIEEDQADDIKKICHIVELHFKRSN